MSDGTGDARRSERGGPSGGGTRATIPRGLEAALLAAIVENSDDAIASKDLNGIVTSWNRAAERLFGYAAEEMIGRHISVLAAPGREDEMPMILARIRRGERVDHFDTLRRRKDGSLVEIALTVSPVRDRRGRIVGASKIARDISARRRLEEERELRVGELRHRVKNLLSVVSAIAQQTRVQGMSAEQYRANLMGRIGALAAAHDAAFQADTGVDLAALVARLLEPYADRAEAPAITIEAGPTASVPREKVQALAFVLHELATNAVKHGAWSVPAGHVHVSWFVEEAAAAVSLHIIWQERDGPPVRPPSSRGFGMKLIDYASATELGGTAELHFDPPGLQAKIRLRLGGATG